MQRLTALSPNTIKDCLIEMDEYQLVRMRVGGRGQSRNHIAWATWQPTLDTELVAAGGEAEG